MTKTHGEQRTGFQQERGMRSAMGEGSAARWWLDLKADRSWCVQRLTYNAVLKLALKMKFCNVRDLKMTGKPHLERFDSADVGWALDFSDSWPGAAAALRAPPPGAMPRPRPLPSA